MEIAGFTVPDVPTITPAEAHQEMKSGQPTVVDVRLPSEYQAGHIQNALNIPLEQLVMRAKDELPQKDARILVYCTIGVKAAEAESILLSKGYTNAASFGGIHAWPYEVVR